MNASMGHMLELQAPPKTAKAVMEVSDDYTVPAHVRVVHVKTVAGVGSFTVTIPHPAECPGASLTVRVTAQNATDTVTVAGGGITAITLGAAGQYTLLFSDGINWYEIATNRV